MRKKYQINWVEKGNIEQIKVFSKQRDLKRFMLSLATHARDTGEKIKMTILLCLTKEYSYRNTKNFTDDGFLF